MKSKIQCLKATKAVGNLRVPNQAVQLYADTKWSASGCGTMSQAPLDSCLESANTCRSIVTLYCSIIADWLGEATLRKSPLSLGHSGIPSSYKVKGRKAGSWSVHMGRAWGRTVHSHQKEEGEGQGAAKSERKRFSSRLVSSQNKAKHGSPGLHEIAICIQQLNRLHWGFHNCSPNWLASSAPHSSDS